MRRSDPVRSGFLGAGLFLCLLGCAGWGATVGATNPETTAKPDVVPSTPYVWRNVQIVAGGFVPGILFSPVQKGLIYARTDMGGAYRWDPGPAQWIPLTDWASQ